MDGDSPRMASFSKTSVGRPGRFRISIHGEVHMRALALASFVALLAGSGAPTPRAPTPDRPTLADLGFLAGCWRGASDGGAVIDEYYTPPSENLILGMSRY